MIRSISHGAAGTVTGSCHQLITDDLNILIDCGMFQGEESKLNSEEFDFSPKEIDFLIVTHAHIDHIGRIPRLVKKGFKGKIISTYPTFEIAKIMLQDASKIMSEEYYANIKKARKIGKENLIQEPLYDEDDVKKSMKLFSVLLSYNKPFKLNSNAKLTYINAGHILGAASVVLQIKDRGIKKKIAYSGDIGVKKRLIIDPLSYIKKADTIFIESTYADRLHKDLNSSIKEFEDIVTKTLNNNGNILIPSFALERTQEILYLLSNMQKKNKLPKCKVFLDSPLAIKATKIFSRFPIFLSKKTRKELCMESENPFLFDSLNITQTSEKSKQINNLTKRTIIISGSGMCNGGRIKHHLKHRIWKKENAVIFVGYQAKETLGRKIVDGVKTINIYGEKIRVKAKIHTIGGFSAHADQATLVDYLKNIKSLKNIYIVHGEPEKMLIFKDILENIFDKNIKIVKKGICVKL